ncbi:ribonucleases P/MRP protein subunit POP1 isoform X2 [Impatiens glandulifera]|nr:ribonucleases P/MRP protein subunit POP1 isoform X2 [Impatiens glandulifera]
MVLTPSPASYADDLSASVVSGAIHRNAMLHHVGSPLSHAIAPVIYMWRPFSHDIRTNHEQQTADSTVSLRQLWVWIHASAFTEGYNSINSACQELKKETDISINCCSLEGQLAKLELMGSKALQLLQKILIPVTSDTKVADISWQISKHGRQICAEMIMDKSEDHIPPCAVIPLFVCDPRLSMENNSKLDTCLISSKSDNVREEDGGEEDYAGLAEMSEKNVELPTSLSMLEGNDHESLAVNLWDVGKGMIHPPLETNILDMEKHDQKLLRFGLGNASLERQVSLSETKLGRFCPILLLNDSTQMGPSERWSIILPLSWVKAFWLPLITKGAHAVGLREKQWISSEVELPSFPLDFPDCNAYSQLMATKAVVSDEKFSLRPPAHRPLSVPPSPPWESIHFAFDEKSIEKENAEAYNENHGSLTEGFVARTSSSLAHFLTENQESDMLLFPHGHNNERNDITKTMGEHEKKDSSSLFENRRMSSTKGRKMCFVRVILHAFREGVFEDGAIICAANVTDINLWLDARLENREGEVQISQSLVSSYFVQKSCGKWEVQLAEDPEERKCHRWPIGFVTSGFVQGSKKGGAVGLCEARLLGYTREAQWNEMAVEKRRKEIFVLVRNMRSTAYRLALATIILEQQNQDLVSM